MSGPFPPSEARVYTIGELTRAIKDELETTFPSIWVEGEVSNLARPTSGHVYLTLKDEESTLRTVIYRGVALRMRYDMQNGMHVIARGRLTVYVPRGEYQFTVEEVQPRGIGPLELAFRQRRERLFSQGYFDPARKKPIPRFPRRIALVTSSTGSAVRDVLEILARRWPAVEVWVYPVRVQGEEAAPEIAAAIGYLNQITRNPAFAIDVMILARGGGSLEDLWPFNEELVAHAIFRSRIPIVTGIGHEDDLTIADLVADQRALTPSEAGERVVPDRSQFLAELHTTRTRLSTLLHRRLEFSQAMLQQLESRPRMRRPLELIQEKARTLADLENRLERAMANHVDRTKGKLAAIADLLEGISPLKVLGRGYSLTRKFQQRTLLLSNQAVKPGDLILTDLHQGQIVSRVEQTLDRPTPS